MRKILILSLCLIFVLFSACNEPKTESHPDIEVKLSDGSIANDQNTHQESIKTDNVTVAEPDVIVDYYVGSNTSKKFHLKDCTWVQKLKEENRVYLSGYNEFIKQGYEPCKYCNP